MNGSDFFLINAVRETSPVSSPTELVECNKL